MADDQEVGSNACRYSKAAIFYAPGQPLEIEQLPLPTLNPSEALVQIECCTVCGSDLHTWSGKRVEAAPSILGHEAIGTIVEVSSQPPIDVNGNKLSVGDRVTWSVAISCFECDRCLAGHPQKCRRLRKYGHALAQGREALSGGLSQFLLLQTGSSIVRLEKQDIDLVFCPANCATATIMGCFRRASSCTGKRVLIFGAGMLGLTAAAVASVQLAASVTVVDRNSQRLALARDFGATGVCVWDGGAGLCQELDEAGLDSQYDLVLELTGAHVANQSAIELADVTADVVLAGAVSPTEAISIDPEQVVRRQLSIHGVHNYIPSDLREAVDFLRANQTRFPFASLVKQTFQLDEVASAFAMGLDGDAVRVAVYPGENPESKGGCK